MNLYLIFQEKNDNYDSFDSAIVAARTKKEARMIHPNENKYDNNWDGKKDGHYGS